MVTFHGPMLNIDVRPDGVDEPSWLAAMTSGEAHELKFSSDEVQTLVPGSAEGMLYGGCLSLLCASLGTPYEIETRGTILFLEDLAEPAFRIDRMLMQLKTGGKIRRRSRSDLRGDAELRPARRARLHAAAGGAARIGRPWHPHRLWSEVGTRKPRKHYASFRYSGTIHRRGKRIFTPGSFRQAPARERSLSPRS